MREQARHSQTATYAPQSKQDQTLLAAPVTPPAVEDEKALKMFCIHVAHAEEEEGAMALTQKVAPEADVPQVHVLPPPYQPSAKVEEQEYMGRTREARAKAREALTGLLTLDEKPATPPTNARAPPATDFLDGFTIAEQKPVATDFCDGFTIGNQKPVATDSASASSSP